MRNLQYVFFGIFSMIKLGQDQKTFIAGNGAKNTDAQIEGNKSNYLLALLLLIQFKEEEDETIIEI